ncbi:MAG: MerR family transcriptional regulator [Acidobacteriaceae bacterium]
MDRSSRATVVKVRHYERQGLLAPAPRTNAGYRMFSSKSVQRIRFIKRAQSWAFL